MRVNAVKSYTVNSAVKKQNVQKSLQATQPSFRGIPLDKAIEVVKRSMWGFDIKGVDVGAIERNLQKRGIEADFSQGSDYARRFIAKSCEITANIFEELGLVRPKKVMTYDFHKIPGFDQPAETIGFCTPRNWGSNPARTVAFNVGKGIEWEDFVNWAARNYASGHSSTGHFLGPTAHEFAHSSLIDNVYKRLGTPIPLVGYKHNSKVGAELLNLQKSYGNTPRIQAAKDIIDGKISTYGTSCPHETFAEGLAKKILTEHVYPMTYKAIPFPANPSLIKPEDRIIYEIWNGLAHDGKGLI